MNELAEALHLGLIAFAIAHSFARTHGPFGLFELVRSWVWDAFDEQQPSHHWILDGVTCRVCIGFNVCLAMVFFGVNPKLSLAAWGLVCLFSALTQEEKSQAE